MIWDKVSDFEKKKANPTAIKVVIVMVIPVTTDPKIRSSSVPSFRLRTLVDRRISVSMLYPISMIKAATPAVLILTPITLTVAMVMIMSQNAARTTAMLGTNVLKVINTVIAMKIKEIMRM